MKNYNGGLIMDRIKLKNFILFCKFLQKEK